MLDFGRLINATSEKGHCVFPLSDIQDMEKGAKYIPFEVTKARRDGKDVQFIIENGTPLYWEFEDGSHINYNS